MQTDLNLQCTCGQIRGWVRGVTRRNARRLSCLCDDCQTYAHFLGRASDILDAYGGTDLSYSTPAQVQLTHGHEQLACVRLRATGLLRWYADCCKTPLLNSSPSPRIAFLGIPHLALHAPGASERRDRELGPLRFRLQARFAVSPPPEVSHPSVPLSLLSRGYARIVWDSLRGRHTPSPLFDTAGQPVVAPRVLS